ncbi:hypothetical protein AMTR_s00117p00108650 [Amborella trichopoda]|uniref:Uncharacterized protein n=1 Tax=Amborella trichopoda TaxID=13333 RepID=W1NTP4_AMBTC|nr:hypothetical protein AMTR_s00117p00108650 [Amborella trichopoda]
MSANEATLEMRVKRTRTIKNKDIENLERSTIADPKVHRKSTQMSKRALSSLDASPSIPSASSGGVDLPPRLKKHAKMKASPSPSLPSEVIAPVQDTIPEIVVTQQEMEAPIADNHNGPEIVQSPTLSSLSQGDFLCTIIEEGNILEEDTEAIGVVPDIKATTLKVPASIVSEAEPQPQSDASSSKTLQLVTVPIPEAPILIVPYVGPPSKLDTPSSASLALLPKESTIVAEVPYLIMIGSSSAFFGVDHYVK